MYAHKIGGACAQSITGTSAEIISFENESERGNLLAHILFSVAKHELEYILKNLHNAKMPFKRAARTPRERCQRSDTCMLEGALTERRGLKA